MEWDDGRSLFRGPVAQQQADLDRQDRQADQQQAKRDPHGLLDWSLCERIAPGQGCDQQHAERIWGSLSMLNQVFRFKDFERAFGEEKGLERGRDFWQQADYITQAIRDLRGL